jgi:phosphodiesterase/alkaline phosphatase D-like protein
VVQLLLLLLLLLQVLDILASAATNPVVLSGDIHNAFVWRLIPDNATAPVGVLCTYTASSCSYFWRDSPTNGWLL